MELKTRLRKKKDDESLSGARARYLWLRRSGVVAVVWAAR